MNLLFKTCFPPLRLTSKATPGQASIELVMSFLLFVAMIGSLLSLSMYMYMNHTCVTAAKEGARRAAIEVDLASSNTQQAGYQEVRNWVKSFVTSSTGMSLSDSNIVVSGPTGSTVGERTVSVQVSFVFQNPVAIRTFMNHLSGGSSTGLDTFTISNTATMRYEE